MTPENKIISGLWIARDGKPLSNMERMCIHSFCANGHDFHLYVYDDIGNVPTDTVGGKVKVCDANEILPESKIFTYGKTESVAGFADWFRWELMRKKGGWYVDMDVTCLRPFDLDADILFSCNDISANSAIMKFPTTHPLVQAMADACASPNRIMPWDDGKRIRRKISRIVRFWANSHTLIKFGESGGPHGFYLALKYFGVPYPDPTIEFEVIQYGTYLSSLTNETLWKMELLTPLLKNAYSIHWFNLVWCRKNWDKNGTFAEHSPYEVLKRRYLPEYQKNTATGISHTP